MNLRRSKRSYYSRVRSKRFSRCSSNRGLRHSTVFSRRTTRSALLSSRSRRRLISLSQILRISTSLTIRLASHPSFFKRIVDQLARGGKAVTRLNLLKILKSSLEALGTTKNNRLAGGFQNYDQLVKVVGGIAEADQAILVRQLAKELGKELGGYLGSNGSGRGTLIGLGKRRSLRKKSTDASGRLVSGGESKRNSGEVRKVSSIQAKKRSDD